MKPTRPRPQNCKKCRTFIGGQPGRKAHCLVCLDKLARERAVPWARARLSPDGSIFLCCDRCKADEYWENYLKPITNECRIPGKTDPKTKTPILTLRPILDRLAHHLNYWKLVHKRCLKTVTIKQKAARS